MFSGRSDSTGGKYLVKHHVEEIDALFGPFPSSLLDKGKSEIVHQIFDEDFRIKDPTDRKLARLETWVECQYEPWFMKGTLIESSAFEILTTCQE